MDEALDASQHAVMQRYGVFAPPVPAPVDHVVRIAAQGMDVPTAFIAFHGDKGPWVAVQSGSTLTPAQCQDLASGFGLDRANVQVVEKAQEDERLSSYAFVRRAPGLRFCAAVPLQAHNGSILGAIYVLDTAPRGLAAAPRSYLCDLGALVMNDLEREASHSHRRDVLQSITAALYALDRQWRFTYVNARAAAIIGQPAESLLGKRIWAVAPVLNDHPLATELRRAAEQGEPQELETYSSERDRWFRVRIDPSDQGLTVIFEDVTEKHEVQAQLCRREQYLSVTLNSIEDAVVATDPEGRIQEMNATAEELTGWTRQEATGRQLPTVLRIRNAETGAPVENPVTAVLREGTIVGMANHTVLTARGGTERQIADSAAPIRDENGTLWGVVLVFRDVTSAYEQQKALAKQRERLQMALIGGNVGMWDWDMRTGATVYDERWANILGYSQDEVGKQNSFFERHTHPEDLRRVYEDIDRHARGEIPYLDQEIRMRHKDGTWRWVLDRGRIVERAQDGTPVRMVGTHVDITDRKRAEQRVRRSLKQTRGILETTIDGYVLYDGDGTIRDVNPAYCKMLGYSRDELLGMNLTEIEAVMPAAALRKELRLYVEGGYESQGLKRLETKHRHKEGHLIDVEVSVGILLSEMAPRLHAFVRDITERKQDQQALLEAKQTAEDAQAEAEAAQAVAEEASRLKSALLANMSHEVRTPLTSIIGFSEILDEMGLESPASRFSSLVYRSGQRLLNTLDSVLDLSQLEAGAMTLAHEPVDAGRIVNETVAGFQLRAREAGVDLSVQVPESTVRARLDRVAFERIVSNLVSNAIKFTGEGPALGGPVDVSLSVTSRTLTLTVDDSGVGIDADFAPHLFEAFQQESTGSGRDFEGSGLGLAITKELVDLMGGTITAESTKHEGATFTVQIPRSTDDRAGS